MKIELNGFLQKLALIFLVMLTLYFAKDFIIPLCVGGILATLFLPFCNWMQQKHTPKGIAVFICLFCLLLTILILILIFYWRFLQVTDDLALIEQQSLKAATNFQKYIFDHLNITIKEQFLILKKEQPSYSNIFQVVFGSIASLFASIILVLVYFVFLLYYRNHLRNFLLKMAKPNQVNEMKQFIHSATQVSQQYLLGMSKMIILLWMMYGIGFGIIGIENAIFFAILCGLLEIIPYIGNIIGTLLTVLFAAIHGDSLALIGGVVLVYGIVQIIQGWILEPLILGPQVKINPLFTIIALVVGQLIWGISGIILAIPLTAIFKIICDHIEPLKPYGFLIGEITTPKK